MFKPFFVSIVQLVLKRLVGRPAGSATGCRFYRRMDWGWRLFHSKRLCRDVLYVDSTSVYKNECIFQPDVFPASLRLRTKVVGTLYSIMSSR
jgi:hypothetical protein